MKGLKTDLSNYTPIFLLPLFLSLWKSFSWSNKRILQSNSDFRKITQQIHISLFWKTKFVGKVLMIVYKAFDMINHDILLKKLNIVGFTDHTVKWFQSNLSNRKFTVNSNNYFSKFLSTSCSMWQGSMLLIYFSWPTLIIWRWQLNVIDSCMLMTNA